MSRGSSFVVIARLLSRWADGWAKQIRSGCLIRSVDRRTDRIYVRGTAPEVGPATSMAASRNDTACVMVKANFFTGLHLPLRAGRPGTGATRARYRRSHAVVEGLAGRCLSAGAETEPGENGEHTAVLVGRLVQAELGEDARHVRLDGAIG